MATLSQKSVAIPASSASLMRLAKVAGTLLLLTASLMAGCSFQPYKGDWNLKSVKNDRYIDRILKAQGFFQLKTALAVSGYSLVLEPRIGNEPEGALSSLYADGLTYDLSNQDTSEKMSVEMQSVLALLLPGPPKNSALYLEAQLDMTHSHIRVDAGSIRTELRYTLNKAPKSTATQGWSQEDHPPRHNPAVYQRSMEIQASFDGSRMSYEVRTPSKPLSEMERFEVILSDLSNQAMEAILTDPELAAIIATLPKANSKIQPFSEARQDSLALRSAQ